MVLMYLEYFMGRGWFPSTDGCPGCRAPREVQVLSLNPDDRLLGTVEVRCHHERSCSEVDYGIPGRHNEHIMTSYTAGAGWKWSDQVWVAGQVHFHTFSWVGDVSICCACQSFITSVPLIVWGPDEMKPDWEAHFCAPCVKEHSLDKQLLGDRLGK